MALLLLINWTRCRLFHACIKAFNQGVWEMSRNILREQSTSRPRFETGTSRVILHSVARTTIAL